MEPRESRIELTCLLIPPNPFETDKARTSETRAEWSKAKKIARRHKIDFQFLYSIDRGARYGDGYLYPSLAKLEQVLYELDYLFVGFDNIDLPLNAPSTLVERLKARYPLGLGVSVNIGGYK